MTDPTPHQLAAILTKAANARADVKRALFQADEQDIIGEADLTKKETRRVETRAWKLLHPEFSTIGAILDRWLGDEPLPAGVPPEPAPDPHPEDDVPAVALLEMTPAQVMRYVNEGRLHLPNPPPPGHGLGPAEGGHLRSGPRR